MVTVCTMKESRFDPRHGHSDQTQSEPPATSCSVSDQGYFLHGESTEKISYQLMSL